MLISNTSAQSGCEPVSMIGEWKLVLGFLDELFGFDRIWSFSREGKVAIYFFDPAI